MQRSRFLKTRLRENIQGNFLYIDLDTMVTDRLDDIDDVEGDLAMVPDLNRSRHVVSDEAIANEYCRKAKFLKLEKEPYFNGGVFFSRDTFETHRFFDVWHECWKKSLANGVPNDQPALCEANRISSYFIRELSGIWNCQYSQHINKYYKEYVKKSKILHYYTVAKSGRILTFVKNRVLNKQKVDFMASMFLLKPRLFITIRNFSLFLWRIRMRWGSLPQQNE